MKLRLFITVFLLSLFIVCNHVHAFWPDLSGYELVLYVSVHELEARHLMELFRAHTNVSYSYLLLSPSEVVERVALEWAEPRADLILGGGAEYHQKMAELGNLALASRTIDVTEVDIPIEFRDPAGYWAGFSVDPLVIGINTQQWEKETPHLSLPIDLLDLVQKPELVGNLVMPDPLVSDTGYVLLASLLQRYNPEYVQRLFKSFFEMGLTLRPTSYQVARNIALGKEQVGICLLSDLLIMRALGLDVQWVIPQGLGYSLGAFSIVRNGPNPYPALVFAQFLFSEEALRLYSEMSKTHPVTATVTLPKTMQHLGEMPLFQDYSFLDSARKLEINRTWWKTFVLEETL